MESITVIPEPFTHFHKEFKTWLHHIIVVRLSSYRRTTWYSVQNKSVHIFARKLFLANLDSASKVESWFHLPPLPDMGILDFSKFELGIKSWKLVSTPPPKLVNARTTLSPRSGAPRFCKGTVFYLKIP